MNLNDRPGLRFSCVFIEKFFMMVDDSLTIHVSRCDLRNTCNRVLLGTPLL